MKKLFAVLALSASGLFASDSTYLGNNNLSSNLPTQEDLLAQNAALKARVTELEHDGVYG